MLAFFHRYLSIELYFLCIKKRDVKKGFSNSKDE